MVKQAAALGDGARAVKVAVGVIGMGVWPDKVESEVFQLFQVVPQHGQPVVAAVLPPRDVFRSPRTATQA